MGQNDRSMAAIQSALSVMVITLALFLCIAVGSVITAYFLPNDFDGSVYEQ